MSSGQCGFFSLLLPPRCGFVKPVCGPVTSETCTLKLLLGQRRRNFIPVVDAAASERVFTVVLERSFTIICGSVNDWGSAGDWLTQPWAGCTRSHLTGRSLTTSSCSSSLHPAGSTPTTPKQPIYALTSWIKSCPLGLVDRHSLLATMVGGKQPQARTSHLDGGWGWVIVGCCFMVTVCTRAVTR